MFRRFVSLTLLMTFAGSTFGLPLPMSSRSGCDRAGGCQCSRGDQQAGTCCCKVPASPATKSCCQKKAVAPCCQRRQNEYSEEDGPPAFASRCGCGEEFPGLITTGHEPRLIERGQQVTPPLSRERCAIPEQLMLSPMSIGPDDPVPRKLVG